MYCTNCGKQIPDDMKFCPYCGAPVIKNEQVHMNTGKAESKKGRKPVKKNKKRFLATAAGKAVIAGAIVVAAAGGGVAGVHYYNEHVSGAKASGDKKQASVLDQDNVVWVKKPGSLQIDDFEDLTSSNDALPPGMSNTMANENFGYSPVWIDGNGVGYSSDAIITIKDDRQGISNFSGRELASPSFIDIHSNSSFQKYLCYDAKSVPDHYLKSDYSVDNIPNGWGDTDYMLDSKIFSGNQIYTLDALNKELTNTEDVSTYSSEMDVRGSMLIPEFSNYQSGMTDFTSPDGFELLKSGEDPVALPQGMTPVYYETALNLDWINDPDDYAMNTCFVNGVIKLYDQDNKKIHLWNADTKKYISDKAFDDATFYEDGYIGVKKGKKWAFMDQKGKLVTDYVFDKVSGLNKGKAYVKMDGDIGILDLVSTLKKAGITDDKDNNMSMLAGRTFSLTPDPNLSGAEGGDSFMSFTIDEDGNMKGGYIANVHTPGGGVSGKFTDLEKVDDDTYQMKLTKLKTDTGADVSYFGLEDNATYLVKLPGTKVGDLDPDSREWVENKFKKLDLSFGDTPENTDPVISEDDYLNCYTIVNPSSRIAFTEDYVGESPFTY